MNDRAPAFGKVLREKRTAAKISLRQFAEQLGVSATYLSQVEQCNTPPPTAERIQHMAQLLNTEPDPLLALAGRVPEEISEAIRQHPAEISRLIRVVSKWESSTIANLADILEQTETDRNTDSNASGAAKKNNPKANTELGSR